MRLAALYAVMAKSYTIEQEHLEAALALWDYAEAAPGTSSGKLRGTRWPTRSLQR
jgi:hypothetical protein